jgi:hypothetical protein
MPSEGNLFRPKQIESRDLDFDVRDISSGADDTHPMRGYDVVCGDFSEAVNI